MNLGHPIHRPSIDPTHLWLRKYLPDEDKMNSIAVKQRLLVILKQHYY